jgi:hypothetical protein
MQYITAQPTPINRQQFFLSDSVINVQLSTNIKELRRDKKNPVWLPAHIVMNFSDTLVISENIRIQPRGSYRKENCDIASLMLDFGSKTSPLLSDLKKLKLVGGCHNDYLSDRLLLREYLVYKLYNMLSVMSFRVRLLHITYTDSTQRMKPYTQYAFLIEDIKDVAARNNCREVKNKAYATEATNRQQINFVSIFQYMIGNTDWAIPNYHNIKLMVPLTDTFAKPFPVPYDFDYCGVVNAYYATPSENLEIKTVRERYYRGYERTIEELEPVIAVFNEKHEAIKQYVNNFYLLGSSDRKDVASYLEQFFDILQSKVSIRYTFISNAINR